MKQALKKRPIRIIIATLVCLAGSIYGLYSITAGSMMMSDKILVICAIIFVWISLDVLIVEPVESAP